jgi:hypothetical protein
VATSASPLGLDGSVTAARLDGTEEVNATPTSFTPFAPDFTVGSTVQPTLSGSYVGIADDVHTFKVTREGTIGVNDVQIKVYDQNQNQIQTIDIKKEFPIGTPFLLTSGLTATFSGGTLRKTEFFEVNLFAADDSYSPANPTFQVLSTTAPTLSGVYTGAGDDIFRFEVSREGTVGQDDVKLKVFDSQEQQLEEITFDKDDPIGTPVQLQNGLKVSLAAGFLADKDSFTVSASATVGSAVDPDKAFNGTGNDIPNFEDGVSVTAGSFTVNGESIQVDADDTINSILAKITSSGAGVTASFDSDTETVSLIQNTAGSSPTITFGEEDTSGFLAATKLQGAVVTPGTDGDLLNKIEAAPALSSIADGTFSINGVEFSVDISQDSLQSLIDQINQSEAGVVASYSETEDKIRIRSSDENADLVLDDGASGFFSAVKITPGTYSPRAGSQKAGQALTGNRGKRSLSRAVKGIQDLFTELARAPRVGSTRKGEASLRGAFLDAFRRHVDRKAEGRSDLRSGLGIDFVFSETGQHEVRFDASRLDTALRSRSRDVNRYLFEDRAGTDRDGLFAKLDSALDDLIEELDEELGSGGLVDVVG